jgi:hypothetical protein
MKEEKIIMYDSPEAASCEIMHDVPVWTSRTGFKFYGNDAEHLARYEGCTHRKCERCGKITSRYYTLCDSCMKEDDDKKFYSFPVVEWKKDMPVCRYRDDAYFWDMDGITDYCEENDIKPSELQLVLCEPVYAKKIDFESCYEDDLPEDSELPEEIAEQAEKYNSWIHEHHVILSYSPTETRIVL